MAKMPDLGCCRCATPGYCKVFKKEMGVKPPNWKWCQDLSREQREEYWHVSQRPKPVAQYSSYVVPVSDFLDILPPKVYDRAVCVIAAEENAEAQLKYTRASHIAYAKKCNADYIELRGDQTADWPMANKYRVEHVASEYGKTLYVDCDVFIKSDAPDIFEATPDDKLSAYNELPDFEHQDWIVREQEHIIKRLRIPKHNKVGKLMLNGGVLVIPQSCSHLYSQPKVPFPRFWCFDQNHLSVTCLESDLYLLPKAFNTSWVSRKSAGDRNLFNNVDEAHFLHINDAQLERKIKILSVLHRCENGEDFKDVILQVNPEYSDCPRHSTKVPNKPPRTELKPNWHDNIQIAILGHRDEQFKHIKNRPYVKMVNLNKIECNGLGNEWAESRAFFSDEIFDNDKEFVGTATASWNIKYLSNKIDELEDWENLSGLLVSKPEDKVVLCADVHCCCMWFRGVCSEVWGNKEGSRKVNASRGIRYLVKQLKMKPICKNVPYSQQVFMHRDNYAKFRDFMSDERTIALAKEAAEITRDMSDRFHRQRPEAYYMEFISTLFFSNQDWVYIPNTMRDPNWYKNNEAKLNE